MLFNSAIFIFLFVPITLLTYAGIDRSFGRRAAITWLTLASFFFYGYWKPIYFLLLAVSLVVNYFLGRELAKGNTWGKAWLALGAVFNLGLIGYFKYTGFILSNVNAVFAADGGGIDIPAIILPLGISFYTFQELAFLVDAYRGETREYDFIDYCLFVTFFPQLIAGPIVHHKEIIPQLTDESHAKVTWDNLAKGISIFSIGLFKKVVIADTIAVLASQIFAQAENPQIAGDISFFAAWAGAVAYTFQLYFDFSGYSDMAVGLGWLFGIQITINFDSPYKATSIIEFWRRWHMTLSRFLRDYLYISLGGNRHGSALRYTNLMITMLLGGLWHGASWNFVIWGGLHGVFLVINNLWRALPFAQTPGSRSTGLYTFCCLKLTFIATVAAWVLFRAPTLDGAAAMYRGMLGLNGVVLPAAWHVPLNALAGSGDTLAQLGISFNGEWTSGIAMYALLLAGLAFIVFLAPNVSEMFSYCPRAVDLSSGLRFSISYRWAFATSLITAASVVLILAHRVSEFLYFDF